MTSPAASYETFTATDLRDLYFEHSPRRGNVPVAELLAYGVTAEQFRAAVAELGRRYSDDGEPQRLDHFEHRGVELLAINY